jgi:hypothetical protein
LQITDPIIQVTKDNQLVSFIELPHHCWLTLLSSVDQIWIQDFKHIASGNKSLPYYIVKRKRAIKESQNSDQFDNNLLN